MPAKVYTRRPVTHTPRPEKPLYFELSAKAINTANIYLNRRKSAILQVVSWVATPSSVSNGNNQSDSKGMTDCPKWVQILVGMFPRLKAVGM